MLLFTTNIDEAWINPGGNSTSLYCVIYQQKGSLVKQ